MPTSFLSLPSLSSTKTIGFDSELNLPFMSMFVSMVSLSGTNTIFVTLYSSFETLPLAPFRLTSLFIAWPFVRTLLCLNLPDFFHRSIVDEFGDKYSDNTFIKFIISLGSFDVFDIVNNDWNASPLLSPYFEILFLPT